MKNKKIVFIFVIFIFSITLRLSTLNELGKTWDESAYEVPAYHFIQLLEHGDITNSYWMQYIDEPPLARYLYGLGAQFDAQKSGNSVTFPYDYTYGHIVSALAGSLAVVFVFLIGWEFFSPFIGVVSAIILSTIPLFLGLSQLVSLESFIMLFYTSTMYFFLKLLKNNFVSRTLLIITGILLGFALSTKITDLWLVPTILWATGIWYKAIKSKETIYSLAKKLFYIFGIAGMIFFILWPMPWFHLKEVMQYTYHLRVVGTHYSIPEVFFGKLVLTPKEYYIIYFLITTPTVFLLLFFVGLISIVYTLKQYLHGRFHIAEFFLFIRKNPQWIPCILFIWFCIPFLQSLYNFRQHGVRYIIEIYAPFSLLAAIGCSYLVNKLSKQLYAQLLTILLVLVYAFSIVWKTSPYYLDYFNIFVGGTSYVYQNQLFQIGWWGEGIREASLYVESHAKCGQTVGLAVVPLSAVPPLKCTQTEQYQPNHIYDFVIVSTFNVVREGFDDQSLAHSYKRIYSVYDNGARLADVYAKQ